ncbi:aminotransferase class V-fold PLP-dependent enzyme [Rubinisphaera margarita]|uniref:aminotransferase class V-fold PLP-dependent enzyme n=1 Tax=Rubinisphaera margarita TaxID=2909586 RepID=UPI001EE950E4|nr:aminotransferase class V-fold PLP-dependent enzyme [Rubinisphaera margarita]MCG6154582.1 aminotransferase class V-fold PLP-dependent enzyme [Rubinisphaera margarita]
MKSLWTLDPNITYLNHGSFGPSPLPVQQAQREWMQKLEANPMNFLVRERETCIDNTLQQLAEFVGARATDLVPVRNATVGMNIVANSLPLAENDEILLTDHEYGAVQRLWQKRTAAAGAKITIASLPAVFQDADTIVEAIFSRVTERTRLIVVSHVTSSTALVLPVEQICRRARKEKIPVVIDGPHAIAMRPLRLQQLGCDFYTVSCHKWLSAGFGSGFLYVHPRWQHKLDPPIVSWGGTPYGRPRTWQDEYLWLGTDDPAPFLSISAALDFLQEFGIDRFRHETHELAARARQQLLDQLETAPLSTDSIDWYGSMVTVPLPETVEVPDSWTGKPHPLQENLWKKHRIEIPIIKWNHRMNIRVSCHLYNSQEEIDRLLQALRTELG